MVKYLFAISVAGFIAWGVAGIAQESACLHGASEGPAELTRRHGALRVARQVNTVENAIHSQGQRYRSWNELSEVSAPPEGFHAQLSTDGITYAFSIKDTWDACHFAFFSDQEGVIYTAVPIR
ncbi:MAG: hypothetical protein DMF94_13255 [Acidobacteria bacterium]|nr:MAG: hypothetical protein DMF94_13255 [Acidobacteriota bacterium]